MPLPRGEWPEVPVQVRAPSPLRGLVAVSLAALFGAGWLLWAHEALSDCMGFYHLAVARLYLEAGIVRSFPAIPFSELAAHYVDQHFLYNLLLAPLVALSGDGLFAVRLATLLWLAALLVVFGALVRRFSLPGGWLLALLLLAGVYLFSARMLMPRPMIASAFMLLAFLLALWERRPVWVFLIAFAYGWLYHASVQILPIAGLFILLVRRNEGRQQDLLFTATLGGFALSLILNPFFPHSLSFFIRHTFFMSHGAAGVALPGEWGGLGFWPSLGEVWPLVILLALLALPYAVARRRLSTETVHLLLLTLLYLAASIKAVRFFEYFGLFPPLLAGFLLRDMPRPRRWLPAIGFGLLALAVGIQTADTLPRLRALHAEAPFTESRMAGAATWLNEHALAGETIFNIYSGDFPELLYHAPGFGYTEGHNHTLMAYHDSERYRAFMELLWQPGADAPQRMGEIFSARYLVASSLSAGLAPGIMEKVFGGQGFDIVYRDANALVARARQTHENETDRPHAQ